jgi:hypothetical protein
LPQTKYFLSAGERCRSCRLDRCLLMGMDPKMVNIRKTSQLHQFVEALERRRQRLIDDHRMDKFRDCVQRSKERQMVRHFSFIQYFFNN